MTSVPRQRITHARMPLLLLAYPAIDPVLLHLGPFSIRWYAISYIAGLVAGWFLIRRYVANDGLWGGRPRPTPDSVDDLLLYCAVGVIVGGRLGNVLFYDPAYYATHPLDVFKVWEGGMAFHGGLLGALAGAAWFSHRQRVPTLTTFDLASIVAPIGIFLGRLANFIKPELWGRPTDVPWAMIFPGSDGVPRHPSQLYEAALEGLGVFVGLLALKNAGAFSRPGLIAGAFGALYGSARIICEFFRDPDPRLEDLGNGLTMGMVLSVPMIVAGIGLMLNAWRGGAEQANERSRP